MTPASGCGWEALTGDPLPLPSRFRAAADPSCQWVTLRAVVSMNASAVDAHLPRRFTSPSAVRAV